MREEGRGDGEVGASAYDSQERAGLLWGILAGRGRRGRFILTD